MNPTIQQAFAHVGPQRRHSHRPPQDKFPTWGMGTVGPGTLLPAGIIPRSHYVDGFPPRRKIVVRDFANFTRGRSATVDRHRFSKPRMPDAYHHLHGGHLYSDASLIVQVQYPPGTCLPPGHGVYAHSHMQYTRYCPAPHPNATSGYTPHVGIVQHINRFL